eukprot:COSAG06_NODE_69924_length_195_cov_16.031250_1_plen_58_part_01
MQMHRHFTKTGSGQTSRKQLLEREGWVRWCFLQAWRTHQFRETIETSIRKYGDLQVQT